MSTTTTKQATQNFAELTEAFERLTQLQQKTAQELAQAQAKLREQAQAMAQARRERDEWERSWEALRQLSSAQSAQLAELAADRDPRWVSFVEWYRPPSQSMSTPQPYQRPSRILAQEIRMLTATDTTAAAKILINGEIMLVRPWSEVNQFCAEIAAVLAPAQSPLKSGQ